MTDAISGARVVGAATRILDTRSLGPETSSDGSFGDTLAKALGQVQGLQDNAGGTVQAFLRGDPVEIHDVMAAVEEAGIALEMLIEVRNRMTEAYRTVISMQS